MAVENMLDDRKAKAGSALFTAMGFVNAVEALGQARHMLGGYARAMIANSDLDPLPLRPGAAYRDIDRASGGTIFDRVLNQVLKYLDQFVALSRNQQRPLRALKAYRRAFGLRQGL